MGEADLYSLIESLTDRVRKLETDLMIEKARIEALDRRID